MLQAERFPRWRALFIASRPLPLLAAVAAVLTGSALAAADGTFSPVPALMTMACSVLLLAGINMANDYFDYVKGVDRPDRTGPTRVALSGLMSLEELRAAIVAVFALAVLLGLYLVSVGGWPIALVGALCIVLGLLYSAGPYPFGHHGLGDLFVFLFFGFVAVAVVYYIQAHALRPAVLLAGVPCSALATGILVINNLRDLGTDTRAGKRTLAAIIGPKASRLEFVVLILLTYASPTLFWLFGWSSAWILLVWLSAPLAVRLIYTIYRPVDGPRLNRALGETMYLDLFISLAFVAGLLL